jgi:phosphonate degradation associated HDIG domain protein
MSSLSTLDDVVSLYERFGHHTYDEEVTQVTHGVQCAECAVRDGAPVHLVLAALLHDIGHLLEIEQRQSGAPVRDADMRHQDKGADALSSLFGPKVTAPVRMHVDAKRYLCAVDREYEHGLSPASLASLALQGGPMTPEETAMFRAQPGWEDAVRLRRWDDEGKDDARQPATLEDLQRLLRVGTH